MQTEMRRPRRGRRLVIVLAGAALAVVLIVLMGRTPSPVGHWDSQHGQDRFMSAYRDAFADLPEGAETRDVRTDFGVVRVYRFAGDGDSAVPMVLLPGTASSSPVWADNLPDLLRVGDVYAIDLLGEPGMSIQERPITTQSDQAAWLAETLEALPEDSFHLVGLSIGGWTAVNLALHEPASVATLTLLDPVQVFDGMPWETVVRSLPAAIPWLPKSWRDDFSSYTAGGAPVEDVPVAEMIEAGMQHYALRVPQPTMITEEQLRGIEVPMLAIIAGSSVMHDSEQAVDTAERGLVDGTVRIYPDASHAINGEYPRQIAADIAAHISDVE